MYISLATRKNTEKAQMPSEYPCSIPYHGTAIRVTSAVTVKIATFKVISGGFSAWATSTLDMRFFGLQKGGIKRPHITMIGAVVSVRWDDLCARFHLVQRRSR